MDQVQLVARYKTAKAAREAIVKGFVEKRRITLPRTGKKGTAYAVWGLNGNQKKQININSK